MKKCLCCGNYFNKLIKAHIIPKSFYRKRKLGIYVNTYKNNYNKRVPIGLYDKNILCNECEKKYVHLDDYAKKLLIDDIKKYYKYPLVCVIPKENYDYEKVKKFFIFMLWRMSVSNLKNFEQIKLGKYEDIAYKMLSGQMLLDENIFIILLRKNPYGSISNNAYSFTQHKFQDTIRYCLIFEEYSCDIILDYKIKDLPSKIVLLKDRDWEIINLEIILPSVEKAILERYVDKMITKNKK